MNVFGFKISRAGREKRSFENPTTPISGPASDILAFFGLSGTLPAVTIENAMRVPAVMAAVGFLSRTLATIPLHAYRRTARGPERITGKLGLIIDENPNPGMDGFKFRQYLWQQVFTGGRGLAWIERNGTNVENIWPLNPDKVTIRRHGLDLTYDYDGKTYPSGDVIDIVFMQKTNQTEHYGPISLASSAIQLALAMNKYGSQFFAGGGVPPLSLAGPLPAGPDALRRAMADVHRTIEAAKSSNKPIFPLPPGYELKPVGFDPEKGQMTDARRFQVEEIARAYQIPPVFLQDLSRATFVNAEQQDLHLVKHLISQWATALEGEMNLKLFGRSNNGRYVEHNLDGLLRGDFKTRLEGISRAVMSSVLTPNEGRALENRPADPDPAADMLYRQGATVPLGYMEQKATPNDQQAKP